jgi:hypothetical protein
MKKLIAIFLVISTFGLYSMSASQVLLQLKGEQPSNKPATTKETTNEYESVYKDSVEFTTKLLFDFKDNDPYGFGMITMLLEMSYEAFSDFQIKMAEKGDSRTSWEETWNIKRENMYDISRERIYLYAYVLPPLEGDFYSDYSMLINMVLVLFTVENKETYEATQKVIKEYIQLLISDAIAIYDFLIYCL